MFSRDGHTPDAHGLSLSIGEQPKDVVALALIRELNERCLELMVQLARSNLIPVPSALAANRSLWCALDRAGFRRIAKHPVLLLDVHFASSAWWRSAANGQFSGNRGQVAAQLPVKVASELMRETTTLAWTVARMDQRLCTVFFGMTPPVAHLFASFGPLDVERIAARHARHLRLRYDDHPSFWREHLRVSGGYPPSLRTTSEPQETQDPQQRLF